MAISKEMILNRWDYLEKVYYEIAANTYEIVYHNSVPSNEVSELQYIIEHPRNYTHLYPVAKYVNHYKILLTGRGTTFIDSFAIIRSIKLEDVEKVDLCTLKDESKLSEQLIKDYIEDLVSRDITDEQKLLISRDIYNYYIYKVEKKKDFCYAPSKIPDSNLFGLLKQSRDTFLENFANAINNAAKAEYIPIRERRKQRTYIS